MIRIAWLIVAIMMVTPAVPAQDSVDDQKAEVKAETPKPRSSATQHSIRIDGKTVEYTATVGWLIMTDDEDQPIARFGYTAYTRDGVDDLARRPIMFAFNGGPGSSSIWLHMGILGPKRVVVTDKGFTPPPPSERVDNAYSIIDATDLVMVDPVEPVSASLSARPKARSSGVSIRTSVRSARSSRSTSP